MKQFETEKVLKISRINACEPFKRRHWTNLEGRDSREDTVLWIEHCHETTTQVSDIWSSPKDDAVFTVCGSWRWSDQLRSLPKSVSRSQALTTALLPYFLTVLRLSFINFATNKIGPPRLFFLFSFVGETLWPDGNRLDEQETSDGRGVDDRSELPVRRP